MRVGPVRRADTHGHTRTHTDTHLLMVRGVTVTSANAPCASRRADLRWVRARKPTGSDPAPTSQTSSGHTRAHTHTPFLPGSFCCFGWSSEGCRVDGGAPAGLRWMQQRRQDSGIAADAGSPLCHQLALFVPPSSTEC